MHHPRTLRAVGLVLTAALVVGACSSKRNATSSSTTAAGSSGGSGTIDISNCPGSQTAGVSGDTITLASSFPQSGLTAAFSEISKGYKAYFDYLNQDLGGVEVAGKKYKIVVKDKDDQYNAAKTAQNIDELVGSDGSKAFAVFNVVGTSNNIAIRQSLGDLCVPNVFAATGSPAMGNPKYPWTIGSSLPPYTLEGVMFANYLKQNKPTAKVAMLVQNDDFGLDYKQAFEQAIKGTQITVVKVETYPVGANDVSAQITSLAATKADAFFDGGTLLACPDALTKAKAAGWSPLTWVSGTCISKTLMGLAGSAADGVISGTNTQDPQNPIYANNSQMQLYRQKVKQYEPTADVDNGIVAYGWTQGALLVDALKASKALTRQAFMDSVRSLKGAQGGLLVPGASANTSPSNPTDLYMGETLQLVKYDAAAKHFNNLDGVHNYEGQTVKLTPPDLINQ
jgi:branched-chain amino acid transport system substrate-binding protein